MLLSHHPLRWLTVAGVIALTSFAAALAPTGTEAASPTVTTGTPANHFAPNAITITVGDTVTFTFGAGTHIVDLKDVSPDLPIDASHASGRTNPFAAPGTYYY